MKELWNSLVENLTFVGICIAIIAGLTILAKLSERWLQGVHRVSKARRISIIGISEYVSCRPPWIICREALESCHYTVSVDICNTFQKVFLVLYGYDLGWKSLYEVCFSIFSSDPFAKKQLIFINEVLALLHSAI